MQSKREFIRQYTKHTNVELKCNLEVQN